MKYLLYTLLFFSLNIAAQGLKFSNQEQLDQIDEYTSDGRGYIESLPSYYSLEKYVPPIVMQDGGTCVGFSSLYYGLSISYNIKYNNTSFTEKFANSFDPYFIYTILNSSNEACEEGLIISEAMDALYNLGSKKMFYPQFLSCNSSWTREELTSTLDYTSPYKIKNYYIIKPNNGNYINSVKEGLYYNYPVIIGAKTTKSLSPYSNSNLLGVTSDGLWNPADYETIEGGHSMCVIGYDDDKFGGSFKLANSWGADFGDNGYVWIKYSDFKIFVQEAYIMEINEGFDQKTYQRYTFSDPRYKGHIYEGQTYNGYFQGYGIYTFGDDSFLIGKFNKGSREGWFYYIDVNDDEFIKRYKFQNDEVIDTSIRGFSGSEEENDLKESEEYFYLVFPNKKVIIVNEDPDLEISRKID